MDKLPELAKLSFLDARDANRALATLSALSPGGIGEFGLGGIGGLGGVGGVGGVNIGAPGIDRNNLINQLIQTFGPLLGALVLQWLTPRNNPPAPVEPPAPQPVPPSTPVPTPQPPADRIIASLRCHWIGWEDYSMRPGEKHAFHHSINASQIIAGNELVGRGYRGHTDLTPMDQYGKPFYNEDIGKYPHLFAKDPSLVYQDENGKWTCGEGNNRINHYINIDNQEFGPQGDMVPGTPWEGQPWCGLTSEYDEAALTPVILINYDAPVPGECHMKYRGGYLPPDNRGEIFSSYTTTVHIKPWIVVGAEE